MCSAGAADLASWVGGGRVGGWGGTPSASRVVFAFISRQSFSLEMFPARQTLAQRKLVQVIRRKRATTAKSSSEELAWLESSLQNIFHRDALS